MTEILNDNAGNYFVYKNSLMKAGTKNDFPEIAEDSSVYEVVRVIDGVPLFVEDHYMRMVSSLRLLGLSDACISGADIKNGIKTLIEAENLENCNVKISIKIDKGIPVPLFYISRSFYPPAGMVLEGVPTGLIRWERDNPNIKVLNSRYKEAVSKRMEEGGFFEVLLVNNDGYITEGSRSNVFFVKGNKIITAPGSHVLLGITRKYVIQACKNAGFEVSEELVNVDELGLVDAVFLSGTSIKVLPVSSIEEHRFKSSENAVVTAVIREYDRIVEKYIASH